MWAVAAGRVATRQPIGEDGGAEPGPDKETDGHGDSDGDDGHGDECFSVAVGTPGQ